RVAPAERETGRQLMQELAQASQRSIRTGKMRLLGFVIARSVATWRSRSHRDALRSPGLLRHSPSVRTGVFRRPLARNDDTRSPKRIMFLVAEIGAAHRVVGANHLRGTAERHPSGFDQHCAVGEIESERGVLLDDEKAHALVAIN